MSFFAGNRKPVLLTTTTSLNNRLEHILPQNIILLLLRTVLFGIRQNIEFQNTFFVEMNQPRTIILKLLNFKDKERILKNAKYLKNTGIFINEDFSKETIEKRKKLWEDVIKLRKEGKYAILKYDRIYSRDFKK